MNSICIIANGYPTPEDPQYAFIQPIVHSFADKGIKCTAIIPQSITKAVGRNRKLRPYQWIDCTQNKNLITVYQPTFFSTSKLKIGSNQISSYICDQAIERCFIKEKIEADVLYAHFWDRGIAASRIAKKTGATVIIASGESKIWIRDYYSGRPIKKMLQQVNGLICVSTKNYEESQSLGLIDKTLNVAIIPNGYNREEFYQYDRDVAREKLHVDHNDFVGVFVGAFCERKGSERVLDAARRIPDLKLFMIGSGQQSDSQHVIFKGTVTHNEIVDYLNAADFFVLPTLAEGCCNAIVEALACGLPVISSNQSFNDDILNEENSIRIDPSNIDEISQAIQRLKDDKLLRDRLSLGALETAKKLTIEERSNKIINFIETCIQKQ